MHTQSLAARVCDVIRLVNSASTKLLCNSQDSGPKISMITLKYPKLKCMHGKTDLYAIIFIFPAFTIYLFFGPVIDIVLVNDNNKFIVNRKFIAHFRKCAVSQT